MLSAGFIVGEYLNPAPFLPPSLRLAFAVGAGVVSWLVGQGHGLPTVKLAVSSPISLASAYAAMSGVVHPPGSWGDAPRGCLKLPTEGVRYHNLAAKSIQSVQVKV